MAAVALGYFGWQVMVEIGVVKERDMAMVASLGKGLAVVECFDHARPRLSITEVAKLTGLERATARRFLLTLSKLGYANYDGKFFSLTPRVLRLGFAYLASTPLPAILQRVLEPLSASLDESVSASTLDGSEIVYVARASHRRVMSISLTVGSRLPAYCSSMGRVLLAALPSEPARQRLQALARRKITPRTITGVEALMRELAQVRAQGFATIDQELEAGLISIAVPVFDASGQVVAAINCGTHASRLCIDDLRGKVLSGLLTAQSELRAVLMRSGR